MADPQEPTRQPGPDPPPAIPDDLQDESEPFDPSHQLLVGEAKPRKRGGEDLGGHPDALEEDPLRLEVADLEALGNPLPGAHRLVEAGDHAAGRMDPQVSPDLGAESGEPTPRQQAWREKRTRGHHDAGRPHAERSDGPPPGIQAATHFGFLTTAPDGIQRTFTYEVRTAGDGLNPGVYETAVRIRSNGGGRICRCA